MSLTTITEHYLF